MKTCRTCAALKDVSEFSGPKGLDCFDCKKEKRRAYDRHRFRHCKKRKRSFKRYMKSKKGRAARRRAVEAWIARNPDKRLAQLEMKKAIKSGALQRQPCAVCGHVVTDGHHQDYSRPLDVIWLCKAHHGHTRRRYQEAA